MKSKTFVGVSAVADGCCRFVFAQQHKTTRHAFCLELCCSAYLRSKPYLFRVIYSAVADGCCWLLLLSSTEQQGKHFALNPAAVHLGFMDANLYEEQDLCRSICSGTRLPLACLCSAAQNNNASTLP